MVVVIHAFFLQKRETIAEEAYKDVYRACDTTQGKKIKRNAVKVSILSISNLSRIVDEVRLLDSLVHPSIMPSHRSQAKREENFDNFATEIKP